jgi:hypothetical protein
MVTPLLTSTNVNTSEEAGRSDHQRSASSTGQHNAEVLEPGLNLAAAWQVLLVEAESNFAKREPKFAL